MTTEQTTVNGSTKTAMDTVDYVVQGLLSAWDAFPPELRAFVLAVFAVSLLMEWVKRAMLAGLPKAERVRKLWLASLPLGIALAVLGMLLTGKTIDQVYWAVIGLTSGTTAMGVHYVTVKVILPVLVAALRRFMLMVRGK